MNSNLKVQAQTFTSYAKKLRLTLLDNFLNVYTVLPFFYWHLIFSAFYVHVRKALKLFVFANLQVMVTVVVVLVGIPYIILHKSLTAYEEENKYKRAHRWQIGNNVNVL